MHDTYLIFIGWEYRRAPIIPCPPSCPEGIYGGWMVEGEIVGQRSTFGCFPFFFLVLALL